MKKIFFLAALAFMALPAIACAQSRFQGPYIGVHLGWAKGLDKGVEHYNGSTNGFRESTEPTGGLLGLYGGYNWVVKSSVLLGVEGDIEHRDQNDTAPQTYNGTSMPSYIAGTAVKNTLSLRGRFGYLLNQGGVLYVSGGYSRAEIQTSMTDSAYHTPPLTVSTTKWLNGWTMGVGYEQFLSKHISGKVEYRYASYGHRGGPNETALWGPGYSESYNRYVDKSVRLGVAYHF